MLQNELGTSGWTPKPISAGQKPSPNGSNWHPPPKSADHLHSQTRSRDEAVHCKWKDAFDVIDIDFRSLNFKLIVLVKFEREFRRNASGIFWYISGSSVLSIPSGFFFQLLVILNYINGCQLMRIVMWKTVWRYHYYGLTKHLKEIDKLSISLVYECNRLDRVLIRRRKGSPQTIWPLIFVMNSDDSSRGVYLLIARLYFLWHEGSDSSK